MKYLPVILCLLLASCGGSGSSDSEETSGDELEIQPTPAVTTYLFGQDGNLWKPESDPAGAGGGNLVVLFNAQITVQYDNCEVRRTSGEIAQLTCIDDQPWTNPPYSCFNNGGRQTWHASFRCEDAAEVLVTCHKGIDTVIFTVPEAQRGQVCSRFG